MRILVIGGSGHIGTFLVPRLDRAGHDVTVISRNERRPYALDAAWAKVTVVAADRDAEDAAGTFGRRVRELDPDVVIDLIGFTPESTAVLVEALRGRVGHFLHCGTVWIHGPTRVAPTTEDEPRRPFGEYGIRKAKIEELLLREAHRSGFPATILHPGMIVGPGWVPVNPAANLNLEVFARLARGDELSLPNLGMETLHHVHADDVAQAFVLAIQNRAAGLGESFNVVSPAALTLRGYAESMADWFGRPARLTFAPWEKWREGVSSADATATWDHIARSPCHSIEKARRLLGYAPRYTSLEAVRESLTWLIDNGDLPAHDRPGGGFLDGVEKSR
jgi:nucleoside-diphosphate-sugar epimerase